MQYPFHIFTNKKEMEVLFAMFQMKEPDEEKLETKISKLLLPAMGMFNKKLSYSQFMDKIASKRKISLPVTGSVYEKESLLFQKMVNQNLENMTEEQREALKLELIKEAKNKGLGAAEISSITAFATIGALQLSGFSVYLMASSTVGAISAFVGVTLPFAFYTSMSSVIATAISPIGLIIASIVLMYSFKDVRSWSDFKERGNQMATGFKVLARGNYELAEVIFSYFAATRILKKAEFENQKNMLTNEAEILKKIIENLNKQHDIENHKKTAIAKEIECLQQQINEAKLKLQVQSGQCIKTKEEMTQRLGTLNQMNNEIENVIKQKNLLLK